MNSYKRNVYKTKNPPKPVKEPIIYDWYVSRVVDPGTICANINTLVYKDPNSIPVQQQDRLYSDSNLTTPFDMFGAQGGLFQLATQPVTQNDSGERIQVQLDETATVIEVQIVNCELPESTEIFASLVSLKRCNITTEYTSVFVNSEDIDELTGKVLPGGVQLFKDQFLNEPFQSSGSILLTLGGSFTSSFDNFIDISLDGNSTPDYSLKINATGIISEPLDCN